MLLRILLIISGLALGLGAALLSQPAESRVDVHHLATLLVKARTDAILSEDWEALFALTVPGTPARDADIALVDWIDTHNISVQSLHTEVTAATELTEDDLTAVVAKAGDDAEDGGRTDMRIVKVLSVQTAIDVDARTFVDRPIERCAIWILEGSRVSDVRECHK